MSKTGQRKYAPPTAEEQRALRGVDFSTKFKSPSATSSAAGADKPSAEARSVFRANLLALEVRELLAEAKVSPAQSKKAAKVKQALFRVHSTLKKIPEQEVDDDTCDAATHLMPRWEEEKDLSFCFRAPSAVDVVGSYLLGTMVKAERCIDIAVTIPKECLHAKDYLNYRYCAKRAMYLGVITNHLQSSDDFKSVSLVAPGGDATRAYIACKFSKKSGASGYSVKILPSIDEGTFPERRFAPSANNARRKETLARRANGATEADEAEDRPQPATPHYNAAILGDMGMSSHKANLKYLHAVVQDCPNFASACVLFKIWLRQRQMAGPQAPPDAFGGFLGSMLLAHLIKERLISKQSSPLQLFTRLIQYIAKRDISASSGFHLSLSPDISKGKFFIFPLPLHRHKTWCLHRSFE